MNNIIGHIIGIDDIHKKKIIKQLSKNIKIIDLDQIQQHIYNNNNFLKQKTIWAQYSKNIIIKRKQKKLIEFGTNKTINLDNEIKELIDKRNQIRQNIYDMWKNEMTVKINKELESIDKNSVLFLGFNIFPKDYRIKINLPMGTGKSNKFIFDIKADKYASNQIKYYLNAYGDKIIKGNFPLNLLNHNYLINKYDKFTIHYQKQGYINILQNELLKIIIQEEKQSQSFNCFSNQNIYVATLFKSNDIIPVNNRTPIEGFFTKEDAINFIKTKIKNNVPIYLYQVKADQFHLINGKLIASHPLTPISEESLLLTI